MDLLCRSAIVAEYDPAIAVEEGDANDVRTIGKGGDEPLVSLKCTVHVAVSALNTLGRSIGRHGHDLKGDLAVSGLIRLNIGGSIIVGIHHGVCVGEGSNRGRRNEEGGEEGNGLVHDAEFWGWLLFVDRANMRALLSDRIERCPWSKVTFVNCGE